MDDDGGTSRGATYIIYLNTDGSEQGWDKISDLVDDGTILDLDNSDYFGSSVAPLGDWNGDGIQDLVVGAWFDDDNQTDDGAIYMILMDQPDLPGGVAGIHAWYDAAKGVSAEADDDVITWKDISENGRSLSQATSTYRPRWAGGAINGNPAIYFDGGDESLEYDVDYLLGAEQLTIFTVALNE